MAARFCKRCHINWPVSEESCRRCGGAIQSYAWREPDPGTVTSIEDAGPPPEEDEHQRVVAWRDFCFRELGVDPDASYRLAAARNATGGFEVDLGRFRELRKKGWTAEQAVKVLA